jgi:hypothetical protein
MALPSVQQEPEQGAVQIAEQMAAAAPPPLEPTPTQADEAALATVASNATVSETGNMSPAGNGYTVKNPYTLLPARMNMGNLSRSQGKSGVEQQYDAGVLFDMLGRTSPAFKVISEELLGKNRGSVR